MTPVQGLSITLMQESLDLERMAHLHTQCWVKSKPRVSMLSFIIGVYFKINCDILYISQINRLVKKTCTFDSSGEPHVIVFCSLEELFHTPGPGAYSPERAPPCNLQRRPPSYTMGSRTHYRSVDSVPAPNKYSLPPLMGAQVPNKASSASYTISGGLSIGGPAEDLAKTPAPCRYNSTDPNVYLLRRPAFSMSGRHSLPRDGTKKPGPGTYNPEKVTVHKARAPAYSLGIRHSEFVTPLIVNISD